MIKKTVTFTDFNGEQRTEDHFFHLTDAELLLWEKSQEGGLSVLLPQIIQANDDKTLINLFKEIVDMSHGVKSADGRRFIKTPDTLADFQASEAYSMIFMELATNSEAAVTFVKGLTNKPLQDHKKAENTTGTPSGIPAA